MVQANSPTNVIEINGGLHKQEIKQAAAAAEKGMETLNSEKTADFLVLGESNVNSVEG